MFGAEWVPDDKRMQRDREHAMGSFAVLVHNIELVGDPRFRVVDPVRTAEEFLELLRGYGHFSRVEI